MWHLAPPRTTLELRPGDGLGRVVSSGPAACLRPIYEDLSLSHSPTVIGGGVPE